MPEALPALLRRVRACTLCAPHLPLGPRPVLQAAASARILIAGQAPGRKVHASGIPFDELDRHFEAREDIRDPDVVKARIVSAAYEVLNGKGWTNAQADGLATAEPSEAVKDADIIAILTPDMAQAEVYKTQIEPFAKQGSALLFAHGFSIIYGRVTPRDVSFDVTGNRTSRSLRTTIGSLGANSCAKCITRSADGVSA